MISNLNEIYSDQYQSIQFLNFLLTNKRENLDENFDIELVRQLGENEKLKSENVNHIEELLIKSNELNAFLDSNKNLEKNDIFDNKSQISNAKILEN